MHANVCVGVLGLISWVFGYFLPCWSKVSVEPRAFSVWLIASQLPLGIPHVCLPGVRITGKPYVHPVLLMFWDTGYKPHNGKRPTYWAVPTHYVASLKFHFNAGVLNYFHEPVTSYSESDVWSYVHFSCECMVSFSLSESVYFSVVIGIYRKTLWSSFRQARG